MIWKWKEIYVDLCLQALCCFAACLGRPALADTNGSIESCLVRASPFPEFCLTVLRVVVFSEVANSAVSGKTREIQLVFARSLLYGLEALPTEEISALTKRWRRLFLVKLTFMLLPATSWPGKPQEERAVALLPDAHKPSPWSVLASRGAHVCASGLES